MDWNGNAKYYKVDEHESHESHESKKLQHSCDSSNS